MVVVVGDSSKKFRRQASQNLGKYWPICLAPFVLSCYSAAPVNVRAFGEIGAGQKPLTPITLRLKRWSGCRCCLQHEQVGAFGGEVRGGEEGGGGCGDCGGRANSGAGGGGPWSVSASSVLVLPAEDLRSRQLHISAQLNWSAAVVSAWMPRCAPAACRHRAACRLSLRP